MKRWFRRIVRRCGIDMPFTDVVCPHHVKTVRIHDNANIEVVDHRSLVFLDRPEPGDLYDLVPSTADSASDYLSPDAFELERTSTRKGTQVCWMPNEPVLLYALHTHQHGWTLPGSGAEAALYTEFRCDTRTGLVDLDVLSPGRFDAGVAFKRPWWPRLNNDNAVIKYALKQLESEGERATIADDGSRLQWKLIGPKVGERYMYVAFQENGVELWQKRFAAKSLAARVRRLISRPLPSA